MAPHVCPWWGGYFIDNRLRRLVHNPERVLAPFLRPGMTVMDFGCGMGMFSIAMARLVGVAGRVVAIDLQQRMLDVLQKRAAKAGVADRIQTHRAPADSIGIDVRVDFALAFYSAHEVPDPQRLFREIHGCLRSEAKLLLVEPVGHVTAARFQDMLILAEQAGLTIAERPDVRWSRAAALMARHAATTRPPAGSARRELSAEVMVRPARCEDVAAIATIYNESVRRSTATFDTEPKSEQDRLDWLQRRESRHPVLVAERNGQIVGWAAVSEWSERPAYAQTAEASLYVAESQRGQGIGRLLLEQLVAAARNAGLHTILARVTGGNAASLRLGEAVGFQQVGVMREVGLKFGRRLNVHLLQKMLDDRAE